MVRTSAPVAAPSSDVAPCDHPVPLSHLALDVPIPAEGWPGFLGVRGIKIVPDHIGRDSVASHDARRLLEEHRADEIRKARLRAAQEAEAVEADQLRRAQIWRGAPADAIPADVHPATAMLQVARDAARPRRESVLQHALSNSEGITFHPYPQPGPEDDR
jgi:hypothetical protein